MPLPSPGAERDAFEDAVYSGLAAVTSLAPAVIRSRVSIEGMYAGSTIVVLDAEPWVIRLLLSVRGGAGDGFDGDGASTAADSRLCSAFDAGGTGQLIDAAVPDQFGLLVPLGCTPSPPPSPALPPPPSSCASRRRRAVNGLLAGLIIAFLLLLLTGAAVLIAGHDDGGADDIDSGDASSEVRRTQKARYVESSYDEAERKSGGGGAASLPARPPRCRVDPAQEELAAIEVLDGRWSPRGGAGSPRRPPSPSLINNATTTTSDRTSRSSAKRVDSSVEYKYDDAKTYTAEEPPSRRQWALAVAACAFIVALFVVFVLFIVVAQAASKPEEFCVA